MTDYNNGQIHGWNGGECPVHPETEVLAWKRDGAKIHGWKAKSISWQQIGRDADIIAFQVVKAYAEPKVIWVNETKGVVYEAYLSEEAARRTLYFSTTRIAVKYVEARND